MLNAIFYVLKTGCQWRYLPANFPPWQTVFYHFRQWQRRGKWFKAHEALRKATRRKAGRHPDPSVAVLDSQSVKTTAEGARFRGFDGNKKVKGRKRHVLVDTLGLLLSIYTTPANTRFPEKPLSCQYPKLHLMDSFSIPALLGTLPIGTELFTAM